MTRMNSECVGPVNEERISQESEPFENFTREERTIQGLLVVSEAGTIAPWMTPYGAALVKIYGVRRHEGKVQFGIGNEEPPILGWVEALAFYDKWPD